MAQNRYIPYGYLMKNGAATIHSQEAEIIRRIYRQYAEGLSYKAIAQALSEEGFRYMPDKPHWNKNMVARILQNQNYLGTDKYPPIIEAALRQAAARVKRDYTHTVPQALKELRPLMVCDVCGEPVGRRLKTDGNERWYCEADHTHISTSITDQTLLHSIADLQNRLVDTPLPARPEPKPDQQVSLHTIRLQNEIEQMLQQEKLDADGIKNRIKELAALRYTLCAEADDTCAEALRTLKHTDAEPDVPLLIEIADRIQIGSTEAAALALKNGTTLGKGAENDE